jgi:hypothetical protein
LVLVALEALGHRRYGGLISANDTGMTWHTLSGDGPHFEMLVVIESDFSVRAERHGCQHVRDLMRVVTMTGCA